MIDSENSEVDKTKYPTVKNKKNRSGEISDQRANETENVSRRKRRE